MKIGVVSDTHIPLVAPSLPDEVLDAFRREGVSLILHAGDMVTEEALYDLMTIAPVKAVAGNMDSAYVRQTYKDVEIFEVAGVKFLLTHGWGDPYTLPDRIYQTYKDRNVDVMVFGHSHRPCNLYREGVLLFNPGTPTDRVYAERRSFGIITVEEGSAKGSIVFID